MAPDLREADQRRKQALVEFAARGINLRRRNHLDAMAVEAIAAFQSAGIDVLLLKGPALAQALYGTDLERGYFDIDLIVAPAARSKAGQVLSALGYTSVSGELGIEDVANVLHASAWSRLDPEIGNAMIDLHWKLDGCLAPPEIAWEALRSGAEPVTVAGAMVLRLGRPGLAVHTALHLAQHGLDDPKAVADVSLAISRWDQDVWCQAVELAGQLGALDAFAGGLRLIPEGARLADSLGVFPTQQGAWDLAHRGMRPRGTDHLGALVAAQTFTQRASVARRALLPSRAWIRTEVRWAHRSRAHLAAAYVLHLLRTPVWAARAYRFARSRAQQRGT